MRAAEETQTLEMETLETVDRTFNIDTFNIDDDRERIERLW